ncbi:transcriptional regulator, MarR family [Actinobacteria bacterium OK074]|nr:transcriptional regulator, MarR family [Actinobacteria bacterium OK074]
MAEQVQYEELMRQLSAVGAVQRSMARVLPPHCPRGSVAVLTLLHRHGDMRMSTLAELLDVDMSVTSRHVAHVADRGWIERSPDPADKRSRILRLTPLGRTQLQALSRLTADLLADRLSDWSDDDVGHLTGLLARLRASFDECRAAPAAVVEPVSADTTRTPV